MRNRVLKRVPIFSDVVNFISSNSIISDSSKQYTGFLFPYLRLTGINLTNTGLILPE